MISDAYTLQFLLEGTIARPPRIVWQDTSREAPGLVAQMGGVAVEIREIYERSGSRIRVRFRSGGDVFTLHEPQNQGWLRKRYASIDDEQLATLLNSLWRAAAEQTGRERAAVTNGPDEVRARLYQQLLFE
ncbi:MAG: hypothetical protein ABIR70_03580 [Bryobacteraceae bacterium]